MTRYLWKVKREDGLFPALFATNVRFLDENALKNIKAQISDEQREAYTKYGMVGPESHRPSPEEVNHHMKWFDEYGLKIVSIEYVGVVNISD